MINKTAQAPGNLDVVRIRHQLRLRLLTVRETARVTPNLIRMTLGGSQLEGFVSLGFDDHIKLFLPQPGETISAVPPIDEKGPVFDPDHPKPVMRDFTPHGYEPEHMTLQLDFALHAAGPASDWARSARIGDKLLIGGPRGSFVVGTGFNWHLLVGDATALPAIRRRAAELPATARAIIMAQVPTRADQEPISSAAELDVHWVVGPDDALLDAVAAFSLPKPDDAYAWIACESMIAKAIRLNLVERGFSGMKLKASGYWQRGAAGAHEVLS